MTDLSLLDYLKGRLAAHLPAAWRPRGWQPLSREEAAALWEQARRAAATADGPKKPISPPAPPPPTPTTSAAEAAPAPPSAAKPHQHPFPWGTLGGLALALAAQRTLEPPHPKSWLPALFLYALAFGLWWWDLRSRRLSLLPLARRAWEGTADGALQIRIPFLAAAALTGGVAFLAFGGNRFTPFNLILWAAAIVLTAAAFGDAAPWQRAWLRLHRGRWTVEIRPWHLALGSVALVALYFRYVHLSSVPAEMFSDHAEKLLDVADVLAGKTRIFFPRNTGREAIQMYLTACIARCLGTGLSFLSLKLGMATMGILTLPFIYLLGKEIGGKWVGFWATLFTAFAYWPNVIARVALRFALYPAFTAPTLYFFVRGLRRGRRNDFLWAGFFLGLGVHGYSPFRMVPLTVTAAASIYWLYEKRDLRRKRALIGLALTALLSFVVFLPLFRYMLGNSALFFYRGATRLGQVERPYPGNPIIIFFGNLFKALLMPFWDNGEIWVHSIPHRPALDWVTGALYALGLMLIVLRLVRRRRWEDGFLLVSIPLLMLPSILSLAFPNENPSLNRTGAAYIPIFVIVGLAAATIQRAFRRWRPKGGRWVGVGLLAILAYLSATLNADLVFRQYAEQFRLGAWNTSEIGAVVHAFVAEGNDPHQAWVIPYPYWVDTRLVAINAGIFPAITDTALPAQQLGNTLPLPPPKLYILKPEDTQNLTALQQMYPQAIIRRHHSPLPGKDFVIVTVP